jgi:diguanylate cyclase
VTLSIGVATLNPGGDTNASALFRRADAAMYRAKSEGRNRVRIDALQPAVLASA